MAKLTLTDLANLANEATAVANVNANNAAIETALENTLSRDGTSPNQMGASLDMNSHRIINLSAPQAASDPARFSDLSTAPFANVGTMALQNANSVTITGGAITGTAITLLTSTVAVTQSQGDNSTKIATTAYVDTGLALKATIASPTFTGTPAAPTATVGTNTTQLATTAFVTTATILKNLGLASSFRGWLNGLTLSAAGGSTAFGIALGTAVDSTFTDFMTLASAYTKTTASWVVGSGNGSFDGTGSAPSATAGWYHVHEIKRPDTGVVDILTSLSATAPTLPTNYTLFRRIGSLKTDGSFNWIAMTQVGDEVHWAANVVEVSWVVNNIPATTAVTATLGGVPTGVQVEALLNIGFQAPAGGGSAMLVTSLDENDIAPNSIGGSFNCTVFGNGAAGSSAANLRKRTNTSAQIRYRANAANSSIGLYTYGYVDTRGRLS